MGAIHGTYNSRFNFTEFLLICASLTFNLLTRFTNLPQNAQYVILSLMKKYK